MPRKSKISSSPGAATPVKDQPEVFYCTRCPRHFKKQKGNFPASQSPMFRENGGHLPVCRHCIDEMYHHYKDVLGDDKAAIRRICLKFDIYWSENVYRMLYKQNTSTSRVLSYISKANLIQYVGKTFDDTLDEESQAGEILINSINGQENTSEDAPIPESVIDFWGNGLAPSFYIELERRYKKWLSNYPDPDSIDLGEQAVLKQICILEATINRDSSEGKPIDRNVNTLNTLLGSANLKPIQKKEGNEAKLEQTPFGVWIRKIEDTRPVSEPLPEFKDVDGIIKYISVWFLGHLCKMLKINNKYSNMYEEEMSRLTVERPEYEGEDEEVMFEDIFERANHEGGDDG